MTPTGTSATLSTASPSAQRSRSDCLEHLAVVQAGDDDHLAVELDAARGEPRQLLDDVGDARVVEQDLARLPRRGVDRDVERREAVLEDPRDVALLHVGERREVAVGERQPVVVVAHVERLPETLRESLDEAELALVGAAADRRRLELDAERLSLGTLDLVDDLLSVRQARLDDELVLGGEELPVEEVRERAAVHRQELRPGDDAHLVADASR